MEIISTIFKSFGSISAYKNAAYNWKWKAVLYFIIITLISSVGTSLMVSKAFEHFYENSLKPAMHQLENVEIKAGKIKTPNGIDIELKSKDGKPFAVVSEKYVDANKLSGLMFAFENDRFTAYQNGRETSFKFGDMGDLNPDGEKLLDLLPGINEVVWVVIPAVAFSMVFIMNLIYAGLLSIAAIILSASLMPSLGAARCMKIAMVSITPPIIINALLMLAVSEVMPDYLYALISGGIIWYVISGMRKQEMTNSDGK